MVIEHTGGEPALLWIAGNQFHVNGSRRIGDINGAQNFPAPEVPDAHAATKLQVSGNRIKRGGRTYEVAGDHQVDLWPRGNAVRVETIRGWIFRMFLQKIQIFVEFRYASRCMPLRASHHGDEKTAFRQSVELVSNCRKRRISGGNKLRLIRIGNIEEENLLLSFQHAEQAATGYHLAVCRKPDVMKFVPRASRLR